MLLQLLHDAFPKKNRVLKSHYEAKKMMKDMGLGYETIHVCKYDCALFWVEHAHLHKCPICEESRYKHNAKKEINFLIRL